MGIGEFAVSEAPLGDAGGLGAAFGPALTLPEENVKYRYGERYVSEATNRKFLGIPMGIYLGFTPSFSDQVLTLSPDPDFGYSLARLTSQDDPLYIVDVIVEEDIVLDFSQHNSYPVNLVVRATGALGLPHSAEVLTQSAAPTFPTEILIGVVNSASSIDTAEPFNRDTPYAYSGAPLGYGFMKSNAVEELLSAVALNAEVAAARTDLSGFTHPDLDTRIETDGSTTAIAERLGKENRTILADDFVVAAPSASINVSRAFSRFHRNITGNTPIQDFEGFASETRVGAITSGTVPDPTPVGALTDSERNVCAIIDATTEERLLDSSRQVAYGRLALDETTLSGTEITFNNASTTVDGVGTLFTTEVNSGDIIQDPVSLDFFEVDLITSDVQLELTIAFPNATTPGATAPTLRRRFTMSAFSRSGPDIDSPFLVPASTVRVYFNTWASVASAQYDYSTDLLRGFEEAPVVAATTSAAGKALFATGAPDGQAGAIYAIQQLGLQIGPSHVHSVDFDGATLSGPGIVDVTQRGPDGAPGNPGAGGSPGPDGDQGPDGVGFTNFSSANLFRESSVFDHAALGSGVQYSYTATMDISSGILFLTGGNSEWYSPGVFDSDDHFQIDDIEITNPATGEVRLSARVPTGAAPSAQVRFYMNAATN